MRRSQKSGRRSGRFSRVDLICCRNVLIYLQRDVQREVLAVFHYALRPDGYLVLGTAETVESTELFRLESNEHHLYRRSNVRGPEPRLPVFSPRQRRQAREELRPKSLWGL